MEFSDDEVTMAIDTAVDMAGVLMVAAAALAVVSVAEAAALAAAVLREDGNEIINGRPA